MSNSQCAPEPELADPSFVQSVSAEGVQNASAEGAPKLLKGLLIGFAATVTIGLALASWYVGVRIVDAKEAVPVTPALQPLAPAATPFTQAAATVAPAPQPNLYLQVAGLGPQKDATFVKKLEAKGYRARVTVSKTASTTVNTAANQDDSQIVIGPFVGASSLEKAKRRLQAAGVPAIEIAY
jgi:hypothetical protein